MLIVYHYHVFITGRKKTHSSDDLHYNLPQRRETVFLADEDKFEYDSEGNMHRMSSTTVKASRIESSGGTSDPTSPIAPSTAPTLTIMPKQMEGAWTGKMRPLSPATFKKQRKSPQWSPATTKKERRSSRGSAKSQNRTHLSPISPISQPDAMNTFRVGAVGRTLPKLMSPTKRGAVLPDITKAP